MTEFPSLPNRVVHTICDCVSQFDQKSRPSHVTPHLPVPSLFTTTLTIVPRTSHQSKILIHHGESYPLRLLSVVLLGETSHSPRLEGHRVQARVHQSQQRRASQGRIQCKEPVALRSDPGGQRYMVYTAVHGSSGVPRRSLSAIKISPPYRCKVEGRCPHLDRYHRYRYSATDQRHAHETC